MKAEKTKVRRIKNGEKAKISGSSLIFAAVSLFLTIILFIGLTFLQNFLSNEIVYKSVVVAKADIPVNTVITEKNAAEFLTIKPINTLDIPKTAVEKGELLIGQKVKVDLLAGEILTTKDFENLSEYTQDFVNPVEVSVDISDVANADGGKIRGGDLVNITMMFTKEQLTGTSGNTTIASSSQVKMGDRSLFSGFDEVNTSGGLFNADLGTGTLTPAEEEEAETVGNVPSNTQPVYDETGEPTSEIIISRNEDSKAVIAKYNFATYAQYVMENVYVNKALNADGVEIDPSDTDSNASIIIFTIEKGDEADINNALMNCENLRISKVIKKKVSTFNADETVSGSDVSGNEVTENAQ